MEEMPPQLPAPPDDTSGMPACDPPLAISPGTVRAEPLELVQFSAQGGTGDYAFSLEAPSAGQVHPTHGSYLAPASTGTTDTLVLRDGGCAGEARTSITVDDPLIVLPRAATVLPGTSFAFEAVGRKSPNLKCTSLGLESGGSISSSCDYTAGRTPGTDRIRVSDLESDEVREVPIVVDENARMDIWGHERWALPEGSIYTPRGQGGSEVYDITVLSGPLQSTGPTVQAIAPGLGEVRITDRFAGFTEDVPVEVVAPYVPDSPWTGQQSFQSHALNAGDLNGDGYDDAVIASVEVNGEAFYSGGVMVYAGQPGGFDPEPVFVASDRVSKNSTAATSKWLISMAMVNRT